MGSVRERLCGPPPGTYRDKEAHEDESRPETVDYHLLATLLLSEVQSKHRVMQAQTEHIMSLEKQTVRIAALQQQVAVLVTLVGKAANYQSLSAVYTARSVIRKLLRTVSRCAAFTKERHASQRGQ